MRLCSMFVVGALVVAPLARAAALDLPSQPKRFSLGGELAYFSDEQVASSLLVTTWRAAGVYAFDERFMLRLDWGMVLLSSTPEHGEGDLAFRPGNPAVLGAMRGTWGRAHYQLGIGGSGPVSTIDRDQDGRLQRGALNYASGISGLWDAWLWAPDKSALLLQARIEMPVVDKTWLTFDMEPALYVPSRSAWGHESLDVFVPLALSLGARHRLLWFGGFAQAVLMPTRDPDGAQLAFGPWLRLVFGTGYVQMRALFNVDEPLAGERGPGVWGLNLSGGGTL